jgi:hypothetical protein
MEEDDDESGGRFFGEEWKGWWVGVQGGRVERRLNRRRFFEGDPRRRRKGEGVGGRLHCILKELEEIL